jgi:hypothetical protein
MKLKYLTKLLSTPSMAVRMPTRAIIPKEIIKQVITVLVILPFIEVRASLTFWKTVIN